MSIFDSLLKILSDAAPLLSALPIAAAALVQLVYKLLVEREQPSPPKSRDRSGVDWEGDSRLTDAKQSLARQESIAKWNLRTVNSLTFGQYIIGGVLATSFVQTIVSSSAVGFLGVLVLVSSLVHQRYRPDLKARNAKERTVSLKRLVRKAEDLVFELKKKKDEDGLAKVRDLISTELAKVDESELADLAADGVETK
jgi:hypothetical protein